LGEEEEERGGGKKKCNINDFRSGVIPLKDVYIYKKKTSRITFEAQSRPVALRLRSLLLLLWKSVALYSVPVSLRLRSFATLTLERVIYLFFLHTHTHTNTSVKKSGVH